MMPEWRKWVEDFKGGLEWEAEKRPRRAGFVNGEPEWVRMERATMTRAVNERLWSLGLPSCDPADVERAECSACGHSDYAAKWAIGCADIIRGALEERSANAS